MYKETETNCNFERTRKELQNDLFLCKPNSKKCLKSIMEISYNVILSIMLVIIVRKHLF